MFRNYIATLFLLISLVGCRGQTYLEKSKITEKNNPGIHLIDKSNRVRDCCTTTSGAFEVLGHNIPEDVYISTDYPAAGFSVVSSNGHLYIFPGRLRIDMYSGVATFYGDDTLKSYRLNPVK